ncbi:transglycosylase SLT domain-containing protein [Colwellia sp. MB02u-18]|uniref:transglycosylase SLT domain-containing protein n=1 Tax=unclassified Colwellia TaxID=196834 RepID=UPI0015F7546E|nr:MULTISPECIES: transglycosylase SLT domain-containing protein [unclassified Colwellia]MBA6225532.1 transglycosylase SLT domain-containing protein [Colwellia sp. MB3u-45]MBA6268285.1 transglycosylase SLT domain-containing protein [Colwellia sp. MB3u-43]MBA6321692.1 transglycosylase SLT domain-containing protein [Colwellia sp. MB02u-19]MBA6324089.1 transglycosylase SLT domain-containing protein [Colwellia sp. MB02u-18]MBA6330886.1 transglycosylase SLT domain-containing protein [Colwellia sp. M
MPLASFRFFKTVILSALLVSAATFANDESQQRKNFLQAEKQTWNHNSVSYQNLYNQLHYYPLQPYLDQKRLMTNMKLSSAPEIRDFLAKYKGTPLDWPLRNKWLTYLAKRKQRVLFQNFFEATSDVELTCQHYRFQLQSGVSPTKVLPKVSSLWLVGKSQPKVCDPLFKQWQQAGYRTNEVIWQRIVLSADGGKHTLIPYLTRLLPENEQYLAQLWHQVRRDPSYTTHLSKFKNKTQREAEIVAYGLKRLIWRDPKQALDTYQLAQLLLPFSVQQQQQITLKFALALASKNHLDAATWLAKVDENLFTSNLTQWYITDALRDQNWQNIKTKLLKLPEIAQNSLQWQYWYGRSLLATDELVAGNLRLNKLALSRHYYGFLAASYLNKPANFQNIPLVVSADERALVTKSPEAKRAIELFAIGRFYHARKEWNYWLSKLSKRDKLVASKVANEMQWYDRAIFTLAKVGYLNDVGLRFPLGFESEINHYAGQQNINPAWAFAITRRESSFMSDANSPAGAKGLMQIMPGTAKQLARKKVSTRYLFKAKNNIKLGTKYLRDLLDRHDGNQVLATAAYNAGPYRVRSWLKNAESLPADVWIETIPFKETREYVKSVLAYQQIYQHKVGQAASLFDQIIAMNINE